MFRKISRPQLLAVTGWSTTDLDNRAHVNQLVLAHGLALPTEAGSYIGLDCFVLLLSDELVDAGVPRALATQFIREHGPKWMHGLERLEWPELFPPPASMDFALTPQAIAEGLPVPPPDTGIHLAIAKCPSGDFQAVCGTLPEIFGALAAMIRGAGELAHVVQVNLRRVRDLTLAAAEKAGVDLGAPFTRPEGHPEHKEWFAAVEVHRALSFARQKVRKLPGPARVKARTKPKARAKGARSMAE